MSIKETAAEAVKLLKAQGKKLAVAESCTGGMLAAAITDVSGASEVFDFGAVTYSNSMKEKLLGVSHDTLARYGAVSEQTARQMAMGIMKYADSDYGIGITGIAGPSSDGTDKPVGLIYIAIANSENTEVVRLLSNYTEDVRNKNRNTAVETAITMLIEQLNR